MTTIFKTLRITFVTLLLLHRCPRSIRLTLSGTILVEVIPAVGATVTLNDANSSASLGSATTDTSGHYSFTVNDGSYKLTVSASGFDESVVNGITVSGANVVQSVVLISQAVNLSGKIMTPGGLV